jgi:hypothetical protein
MAVVKHPREGAEIQLRVSNECKTLIAAVKKYNPAFKNRWHTEPRCWYTCSNFHIMELDEERVSAALAQRVHPHIITPNPPTSAANQAVADPTPPPAEKRKKAKKGGKDDMEQEEQEEKGIACAAKQPSVVVAVAHVAGSSSNSSSSSSSNSSSSSSSSSSEVDKTTDAWYKDRYTELCQQGATGNDAETQARKEQNAAVGNKRTRNRKRIDHGAMVGSLAQLRPLKKHKGKS